MVTKMATSSTAALHSDENNHSRACSSSAECTTAAAELADVVRRALDLSSASRSPSAAPESPRSSRAAAGKLTDAPEPSTQATDRSAHALTLDRVRDLVFRGGCIATCENSSSSNELPVRPVAWRILLGVLDEHPAHWSEQLATARQQYQDHKREAFGCQRQPVVASTASAASGEPPLQQRGAMTPLGADAKAKDALDQDAALMKEIDKDVSRTQSTLPFFAIGGMAQQWMLRILFVFAKRHPELGYMQGMNEILAPLVFVYGSDPRDAWSEHTEADAFVSFSTIMKSVAPLYTPSPSDPTKRGVDTQMTRLTQLLRQHDALLWQHLNSIGLTPDLYSFRWYMTLLTREFAIAPTLRIWDALLADPKRFGFLHYVSCALIQSQRSVLLQRGFSGCLQTLQTLPRVDLDYVLALAEQMRARDRSLDQRRFQRAT